MLLALKILSKSVGSGTGRRNFEYPADLSAGTRHNASSYTFSKQQMQENGLIEVCGDRQPFKYLSTVGWVGILTILFKSLSFAGKEKGVSLRLKRRK